MTHIIALSAGAIGLLYAYKWVQRESNRVDAALQRAQRRILKQASRSATNLMADPLTGTYSPAPERV